MVVQRFELYLIAFDPDAGGDARAARPGVILSPDEMNRHISTVVVAPLISHSSPYPTRVRCELDGKEGFVVLDQLGTVEKGRLMRHLGRLRDAEQQAVLRVLAQLFAE